MDPHRGGYGQLRGEWVNGFIFDLSFWGFVKAKKVPRVTNINFLLSISIQNQEEKL